MDVAEVHVSAPSAANLDAVEGLRSLGNAQWTCLSPYLIGAEDRFGYQQRTALSDVYDSERTLRDARTLSVSWCLFVCSKEGLKLRRLSREKYVPYHHGRLPPTYHELVAVSS